jgi:hypothetical protein
LQPYLNGRNVNVKMKRENVTRNGGKRSLSDYRNRLSKRHPIAFSKSGLSKVFSSRRMSRYRRNIMIRKSGIMRNVSVKLRQTSASWQELLTRSGRNGKMRRKSFVGREKGWREESR